MSPRAAAVLLVALALVLGTVGSVVAGNVTQTVTQPIGNHWNEAAFWSDGLVPSAGNDYFTGTGMTLRTPEGANSTFGGGSLHIQTGGQILLKSNNSTHVYTANNVILDGGSITHGSDNNIIFLDGFINVQVDSILSAAGANARRINLDSDISGSGDLQVSLGGDDWIHLHGDNSLYDGDWTISFSGAAGGAMPEFFAQAPGSLGQGNITIGTGVLFDVDYDYINYDATLTLNGLMVLDQDLSFGGVMINGQELLFGTYSFAQLKGLFPGNFMDGGDGSITVDKVPEPATLSLLLLALPPLARRARRRRSA